VFRQAYIHAVLSEEVIQYLRSAADTLRFQQANRKVLVHFV